MLAVQILLERLVAEHHSAEILTAQFPLPDKGCAIVKTMAELIQCQAHAVDDGVIVQIAACVKQIIATRDSCYSCHEAVAAEGFYYSLDAPKGGHYELECDLGEPEVFVQEEKTVVVVPCKINLWYIVPELCPLNTTGKAGSDEPVLVDLVFAAGQERGLQHFPLSLAAASGFLRADLEVSTTDIEVLEGQALISGVLQGGLYYAAPNQTERWIPLAKEFTFLIVSPGILPSMQALVSYQLESRLSGEMLKVFITLDWLIIRKEAICLPKKGLYGPPIRVNRVVAEKQVPIQFKERFCLGEEIRKIRDYHMAWRQVKANRQNEFVLVQANLTLQVAGVTPVQELKEFSFVKALETIVPFSPLPPEVKLTAIPETQYLRVELLPRNNIGLLGQATFLITATRRETVELPPYYWESEYSESEAETEVFYDLKLALPRGSCEVEEVMVEPAKIATGLSGKSAEVHGILQIKAVVRTANGQTVQISESLPFWHFGEEKSDQVILGQPPKVSIASQQLIKKSGWKGLVSKWFLLVTIRVVFITRTIHRKKSGQTS